MTGADRIIRWSTAGALAGVAAVATIASNEHAYALVRAHGEAGWRHRPARRPRATRGQPRRRHHRCDRHGGHRPGRRRARRVPGVPGAAREKRTGDRPPGYPVHPWPGRPRDLADACTRTGSHRAAARSAPGARATRRARLNGDVEAGTIDRLVDAGGTRVASRNPWDVVFVADRDQAMAVGKGQRAPGRFGHIHRLSAWT